MMKKYILRYIIYITIYTIFLTIKIVPKHYHMDEKEVEDVKKKYNIMNDSQWPEISRFDPVANVI